MIEGLLRPQHIILILFMIGFFGFVWILPFWKILSKAGYPGVLSLFAIVPLLGLIVLLWFAFSEWPLERLARETGKQLKYCSGCGAPL